MIARKLLMFAKIEKELFFENFLVLGQSSHILILKLQFPLFLGRDILKKK